MTASAILKSMRLRTLPLSLAGVLLGSLLALKANTLHTCPTSCLWLLVTLYLTTVLLQVLSNMSNELGDYLHGTDTQQRQAPAYSLQRGDLTPDQLKRCIGVVAVLCALSGAIMVWLSWGTLLTPTPLLMLLLGAAAIWAAMHYTLGKHPYGYRALGDIFVFIFFGLVAVCGSYFVVAHRLEAQMLLPASAIGLFSVGVLNVNNIRDMATDRATRLTVPLLIGVRKARIYQTLLITTGWALVIIYIALTATTWHQWLCLLTMPLYTMYLHGVWHREERALDAMLPLLVISTFLLALLISITL